MTVTFVSELDTFDSEITTFDTDVLNHVIEYPGLASININAELSSQQFGIDSANSIDIYPVLTYGIINPSIDSGDYTPTMDSILWELLINSEDRMVSIDSVDLKPSGTFEV